MRGITQFGIGETDDVFKEGYTTITYEQPVDGKTEHTVRRDEIFLLGPCFMIRTKVGSNGSVATSGFLTEFEEPSGCDYYLCFDLKTGRLTTDFRPQNPAREQCVILNRILGVHRWTKADEPGYVSHRYRDTASRAFEAAAARRAGSVPIGAHLLVDLPKRQLLEFQLAIASPQGTVYDWKSERVAA